MGDQILEVNGQSFMDVTHDEAVAQLKYHKRMSLLVRDVGKVPHSCTAYDRDWDLCSPGYVEPAAAIVYLLLWRYTELASCTRVLSQHTGKLNGFKGEIERNKKRSSLKQCISLNMY